MQYRYGEYQIGIPSADIKLPYGAQIEEPLIRLTGDPRVWYSGGFERPRTMTCVMEMKADYTLLSRGNAVPCRTHLSVGSTTDGESVKHILVARTIDPHAGTVRRLTSAREAMSLAVIRHITEHYPDGITMLWHVCACLLAELDRQVDVLAYEIREYQHTRDPWFAVSELTALAENYRFFHAEAVDFTERSATATTVTYSTTPSLPTHRR